METCRIDVWLWRARFAKTRSIAAAMVDAGAVRLTHNGVQTRVDKTSRSVHAGDLVTFVRVGRVTTVRIKALGDRRGPPVEARALYVELAPNDSPSIGDD